MARLRLSAQLRPTLRVASGRAWIGFHSAVDLRLPRRLPDSVLRVRLVLSRHLALSHAASHAAGLPCSNGIRSVAGGVSGVLARPDLGPGPDGRVPGRLPLRFWTFRVRDFAFSQLRGHCSSFSRRGLRQQKTSPGGGLYLFRRWQYSSPWRSSPVTRKWR